MGRRTSARRVAGGRGPPPCRFKVEEGPPPIPRGDDSSRDSRRRRFSLSHPSAGTTNTRATRFTSHTCNTVTRAARRFVLPPSSSSPQRLLRYFSHRAPRRLREIVDIPLIDKISREFWIMRSSTSRYTMLHGFYVLSSVSISLRVSPLGQYNKTKL